jgi:hypothetical protein
MKQIYLLLTLFSSHALTAQTDSLSIGTNKVTSLVFPLMIKNVDRGSKDVLVQKVKGVENILEVKAAKENFSETNMTVITADGKLYSFLVHYSADPSLNIKIENKPSIFEKIAGLKKFMHGIRDSKYAVRLQLKGIYIDNDILYYQLELQNYSNLSYDIELLRFFIKDKKQSKRTASQELEQTPLYVYGNTGSVPGQSKIIMVVALPRFTIPDKKLMVVQLMEKNGGRNLSLKINNNKLVKAKVPDGY